MTTGIPSKPIYTGAHESVFSIRTNCRRFGRNDLGLYGAVRADHTLAC